MENPYAWGTQNVVHQPDQRQRGQPSGVVTTDVEDDKVSSGVIGIQHHGEKGQTYKFRNLRIKPLD